MYCKTVKSNYKESGNSKIFFLFIYFSYFLFYLSMFTFMLSRKLKVHPMVNIIERGVVCFIYKLKNKRNYVFFHNYNQLSVKTFDKPSIEGVRNSAIRLFSRLSYNRNKRSKTFEKLNLIDTENVGFFSFFYCRLESELYIRADIFSLVMLIWSVIYRCIQPGTPECIAIILWHCLTVLCRKLACLWMPRLITQSSTTKIDK